MGFFSKLFEKKICSICGGEIGLLGNRKLEDGDCCKACANKLSPWFDDRRHSTVEQIRQQLTYREENRAALEAFHPCVEFGEDDILRAELENGVPVRFVIEKSGNFREENADIVNFKDVTAFDIDISKYDRELKTRNSEGESVSYNPPRYEYSYDFRVKIQVNHPYFDDMRFQLNRYTLNLETVGRSSGLGLKFLFNDFDPMLYPEYRQYSNLCDELSTLFQAGMQGTVLPGHEPTPAAVQTVPVQAAPSQPEPAPAEAGPKFCPNCGAPTGGTKFCTSCGSKL